MNVLDAIKKRREITTFKPDPIPEETLKTLTEALYLAPSGNNLPSREFILITDKKKLTQLTPATPFMKWLEHAAASFTIISDPKTSKYWLQDASIAGAYLWLSAVSLGLGAAWGAIHHSEDSEESAKRESFVREKLGIPSHYRVVAVIGLGYPDVQPPPKEMYPLEQVFHQDSFRGN